ncbi:hypothetical protein ACWKSP_04525 [Micromonosporaceae bacterium Da 78-11]
MLVAKRISAWRTRYRVFVDGRPVTTWDGRMWRSGGDFELDGHRYRVTGNAWGNRYRMSDDAGAPVAEADRVGRKRWTVEALGQTYRFERPSIWRSDQELHNAAGRAGVIRRTSMWRGDAEADLPGLPPPVQVFVLGVVLTMWDAQNAAAAAS